MGLVGLGALGIVLTGAGLRMGINQGEIVVNSPSSIIQKLSDFKGA